MLRSNGEIRQMARECLKGKWVISAVTIFVIGMVAGLISSIFSIPYYVINFAQIAASGAQASTSMYQSPEFTPALFVAYVIALFGSILITPIATYGMAKYFLALTRGEQADMGFAFDGFKHIGKLVVLGLIIMFFIFLWSLPAIIPVVIAVFMFIQFIGTPNDITTLIVFSVLLYLILIIPGLIAYYRYSQAYYILIDNPEISPMEAVNRSKEMMKGNIGKLFLLQISFIGWSFLTIFGILACCVGFPIAIIMLITYIAASTAIFYQELKDSQNGDILEVKAPVSDFA